MRMLVELPPLRSGYGGFPRKRLPNILHVLDLLEEKIGRAHV